MDTWPWGLTGVDAWHGGSLGSGWAFPLYLWVSLSICAFFVFLHFSLISCIFRGFWLFSLFSQWVLGGGRLRSRVEGWEVRWRMARGRCGAGTGSGVAWCASGGGVSGCSGGPFGGSLGVLWGPTPDPSNKPTVRLACFIFLGYRPSSLPRRGRARVRGTLGRSFWWTSYTRRAGGPSRSRRPTLAITLHFPLIAAAHTVGMGGRKMEEGALAEVCAGGRGYRATRRGGVVAGGDRSGGGGGVDVSAREEGSTPRSPTSALWEGHRPWHCPERYCWRCRSQICLLIFLPASPCPKSVLPFRSPLS